MNEETPGQVPDKTNNDADVRKLVRTGTFLLAIAVGVECCGYHTDKKFRDSVDSMFISKGALGSRERQTDDSIRADNFAKFMFLYK